MGGARFLRSIEDREVHFRPLPPVDNLSSPSSSQPPHVATIDPEIPPFAYPRGISLFVSSSARRGAAQNARSSSSAEARVPRRPDGARALPRACFAHINMARLICVALLVPGRQPGPARRCKTLAREHRAAVATWSRIEFHLAFIKRAFVRFHAASRDTRC